MTNFKDTVGYIPANSVKDIPPFDPAVGGDNVRAGSVTANVKVMSGTHAYATVLIEIPSGSSRRWVLSVYEKPMGREISGSPNSALKMISYPALL